jgi:hypothetical protein
MAGKDMHSWATGSSGVESMKIGDSSMFINNLGKGLSKLGRQFHVISTKANANIDKFEAGVAADKAAKASQRKASRQKAAAKKAEAAAPMPGRSEAAKAASNYVPDKTTSTGRTQAFTSPVESGPMASTVKVDPSAAAKYND